MGRPKIKTIETAIDLDKVKLEEEKQLPTLSAQTEEEVKEEVKKAKTSRKSSSQKPKKTPKSKRYQELTKQIEVHKEYVLSEAVNLIKKTSNVKFDASVEAHLNLRIDPEKQEQQIRTTTQLPHSRGKKIKILVFGAKSTKAIHDLGSEVGTEESLSEIEKGKVTFEKIIATPEWMPKLAKVAKILGPKGLMPNPKSGTVTENPEKTVESISSGMVEVKTENSPIIHITVGRVSSKEADLEENIKALITAVRAAKPSEVKKELVKSIFLSSSMGPSVKLDLSSIK